LRTPVCGSKVADSVGGSYFRELKALGYYKSTFSASSYALCFYPGGALHLLTFSEVGSFAQPCAIAQNSFDRLQGRLIHKVRERDGAPEDIG
jgi:hypothetical protein